jgi:hypothetical protein
VNRQTPERTVLGEGKDKTPHTPWAWVPRELDDNSRSQQAGNAVQQQSVQRSQRPTHVESSRQSNGTSGSAAVGDISYPGPESRRHSRGHTVPSQAYYYSVPSGQPPQQQQQYVIYYIPG